MHFRALNEIILFLKWVKPKSTFLHLSYLRKEDTDARWGDHMKEAGYGVTAEEYLNSTHQRMEGRDRFPFRAFGGNEALLAL